MKTTIKFLSLISGRTFTYEFVKMNRRSNYYECIYKYGYEHNFLFKYFKILEYRVEN